jgi:acyl carrier protein
MNLKNEQIISSQVRSIVAEALNLEFDEVSSTASQEEFSEWDSMTYLTILSNIEDKFNISISGENIDKFGSVPQIINEIIKWK